MITSTRLLRLLAAKRMISLKQSSSFSTENQTIAPKDDQKYQDLCFKFERDWQKVQRETEDKQRQVLDAELTPAQKKRIDFLAQAFLDLNVMEVRYFNHLIKQKILNTTGLSPFKVNIDWPSIKQLENGSWPPANPNWVQQQDAIAKLWPAGQAGLAQLFGGMVGGGGVASAGGAQTAAPAAQAAPAAEKAVEAPKEKQNYDIELAGIDAAAKIKIIKEVRAMFNLGLKEAKDLVEKTPCILKQSCKKSEAEELKGKLVALGCTVNLI